MPTEVPQRELRNNPGALLARVEAGEELTITVRGRAVADLVPTRGARGKGKTVGEFIDGLSGLLEGDDTFLDDIRPAPDGERDPWERYGA